MSDLEAIHLIVDRQGDWAAYMSIVPAGYTVVGTVMRQSDGKGGALVRCPDGVYAQANGATLTELPQQAVAAALETLIVPGRPPQLEKGERKNVYLDAKSREIALALGGGNYSEGIREALRRNAHVLEQAPKKDHQGD